MNQETNGQAARVSDSRIDTYQHRALVQRLVGRVMTDLLERLLTHDESKLHPPERQVLDRFPDRVPYGSPEYRVRLLEMRAALEHHWRKNRHHPEFHRGGVGGMTLIDLTEMLLDWMASALRDGGDVRRSIAVAREHYDITDQLAQILLNTVAALEKEETA